MSLILLFWTVLCNAFYLINCFELTLCTARGHRSAWTSVIPELWTCTWMSVLLRERLCFMVIERQLVHHTLLLQYEPSEPWMDAKVCLYSLFYHLLIPICLPQAYNALCLLHSCCLNFINTMSLWSNSPLSLNTESQSHKAWRITINSPLPVN